MYWRPLSCVTRAEARSGMMRLAARLTMRQFSDAFLHAICGGGENVTSTVGCYRLEGRGSPIVRCASRASMPLSLACHCWNCSGSCASTACSWSDEAAMRHQ